MLVGLQSPHTDVIREREDVGGRNVRPETVLEVGGLVRRYRDLAVLTVRRGRTVRPLPPLSLVAGTGQTDGTIARADSEEMPDTRTVWQCGHVVTAILQHHHHHTALPPSLSSGLHGVIPLVPPGDVRHLAVAAIEGPGGDLVGEADPALDHLLELLPLLPLTDGLHHHHLALVGGQERHPVILHPPARALLTVELKYFVNFFREIFSSTGRQCKVRSGRAK